MPQRAPFIQYGFTRGRLDSDMRSRSDTRAYYQGAAEMLNVLGRPKGGVDRRPGLAVAAEIAAAAPGRRFAAFEVDEATNYLVVFTNLQATIFKVTSILTQVAQVTTPWTTAMLPALDWLQSLDTMILFHEEVRPKRLIRQGNDTSWIVNNVPLANIPQFAFRDANGDLDPPEDVWSDTRGWPRSGLIHEGRLYLGGSKSRPQTVWGSKATDYFDFATTDDQLDDEGVEATLDGDKVNRVQRLFSLNDFFVFTAGGVFFVPESPITPKNFYFQRLSTIAAASVRPVEVEQAVGFVKQGVDEDGNATAETVQEIYFEDARQAYTVGDLLLLASDVIASPVAMAMRQGNEVNSANHLFVVNANGTVAVLNTRRAQEITGWMRWTTAGLFHEVVVVGGQVFFLVEREVNLITRWFIERLDPRRKTDAAVVRTAENPTTSWSGIPYVDGAMVWLIGDGRLLGEVTVMAGAVTTPVEVATLELGFSYSWVLEGMPPEIQLAEGTLIGKRHRATSATIMLEATEGLDLNGVPVPLTRFGQPILDLPPPRFTGMKRRTLRGWKGGRNPEAVRTILGGHLPLAATVLAVVVEIAA